MFMCADLILGQRRCRLQREFPVPEAELTGQPVLEECDFLWRRWLELFWQFLTTFLRKI